MRVALCMALAGCSFNMKQAPAVDPGTRPVTCSESRAAPVADVVGAITLGALAVIGTAYAVSYYRSTDPEAGPPGEMGVALGAIGAVSATFYTVSAVNGFDSASRCERMNHAPSPRGD